MPNVYSGVYRVRRNVPETEAMCWNGDNASEVVLWAQGGWKPDGIWLKQLYDAETNELCAFLVLPDGSEIPPGGWIVKVDEYLRFAGVGSDIWDKYVPLDTRQVA